MPRLRSTTELIVLIDAVLAEDRARNQVVVNLAGEKFSLDGLEALVGRMAVDPELGEEQRAACRGAVWALRVLRSGPGEVAGPPWEGQGPPGGPQGA
jgi:hypothetical protein